MPAIRLERTAIRALFLGVFGFDHLQLAYDPMSLGRLLQDDWFVVEGVRDLGGNEATLGVQGADGRLTLSRANAASGSGLTARIGTPQQRGSTIIASGQSAPAIWSKISEHARELHEQKLPYIAYAPPGSASPTLNSSSVIATLLYRVGMNVKDNLPHGMRRAPGIETLIGTAGNDRLATGGSVSTLIGGTGDDKLDASAGATAGHVIKLYGGDGDDACVWSPAVAICHGGLPGRDNAIDGADTIIFPKSRTELHADADALSVKIGSVATRLMSVETLRWSNADDHVDVMPSALRLGSSFHIDLGGEDQPGGNVLDLSNLQTGLVAGTAGLGQLRIALRGQAPITASGVSTLKTTEGDDEIRTRTALPVIAAGGGDDVIVLETAPIPQRVDVGGGANTVVLNVADDPNVYAPAPIVLTGGGSDDRLYVRVTPERCGHQAGPAITVDLARDRLPEGYALQYAPGRAGAEIVLVATSNQRLAAKIILRNFGDGHWGFREPAVRRWAAHISSTCEDSEEEDRVVGLRSKGIQTSQHAALVAKVDDAAWYQIIELDRGGVARSRRSSGALGRPQPTKAPHRNTSRHLRTTGRRHAHGSRYLGCRDDPNRQWQGRAPCRRAAAIQAVLRQAGRQLATRNQGEVSAFGSAPGPPSRAGSFKTAA